MEIRNQIVSYFASYPTGKGKAKVFKAPVSMNSQVAIEILKEQFPKLESKHLLQICFDIDSKRLYVLNKDYFTQYQFEDLLEEIKNKIKSQFGYISKEPIIYGSPFSSLRVRSLDCFEHIKNIAQENLGADSIYDIPIIEVNLNRMPTVEKALHPRHKMINKNNPNGVFLGGYISPQETKGIHFYEEIDIDGRKKEKPERLLSQKAPFILINIGSDPQPSTPEKEWYVLNGYREYLQDKSIFEEAIDRDHSDAFLFAIKRFLKLGWTFEEVSDIFVKNSCGLFELVSSSNELMKIAYSFEKDGYENPAKTPYYTTFKIDDKFPISIDTMIQDGKLQEDRQLPWVRIIDYNPKTKYIIIETPVYIGEETYRKIFKPVTIPLITRYNKYTETIDVKSDDFSYINLKRGDKDQLMQLSKIQYFNQFEAQKNGVSEKVSFRSDENSRSIKMGDGKSFHLRDITDYIDACEQLRQLAKDRGVEFENMNVVVGPVETIFGQGVKGGFMSEEAFKKSEMESPYEIAKGIFVKPPLIAIDTVDMPSPAEQASTLVHEYAHNLYSITNPEHESQYNKDPSLKDTDSEKYWNLYLTDADERQAHSEQVKFDLRSGVSIDEMIRDKVGGQVKKNNYHIAILFKDIIDDVVKKMEEEDEWPIVERC